MRIKKYLSGALMLALAGASLVGCKPEDFEPEGLASFSVANVAPGSPTVDIIVDGRITSAERLTYGKTTASVAGATTYYLPITTGTHSLAVSPDTGKLNLVTAQDAFETGKMYTYVVYDTVLNGKLKAIRLEDNLSLPETGKAKVRVLHTAPITQAYDVTLLRTGTNDSITLSNLSYIGNTANPDATQLSKFSAVNGGGYTVKLKEPGTQNVLKEFTNTLSTGRIYTVYIRGGAKNEALGITTVANY